MCHETENAELKGGISTQWTIQCILHVEKHVVQQANHDMTKKLHKKVH